MRNDVSEGNTRSSQKKRGRFLSPVRLPIPPLGHNAHLIIFQLVTQIIFFEFCKSLSPLGLQFIASHNLLFNNKLQNSQFSFLKTWCL